MDNQNLDSYPSNGNAEPIVEDELKRSALPKIGIILLVVTLLFAVGYLGYRYYQLNQEIEALTAESRLPSASLKPDASFSDTMDSEKASPILKQMLAFQPILNTYCKNQKLGNNSSIYAMDYSKLPIEVDADKFPVKSVVLGDSNMITCVGGFSIPENLEYQDKGYVYINSLTNQSVNIYDANSLELGHGGPPFLGSYPTIIGEVDGVKYSIELDWPHGGCAEPSSLSLLMKGEKKVVYGDKEVLYINTQTKAIPGGLPKLVALLETNSEDCDFVEGQQLKSVIHEGIGEVIRQEFFKDLSNLDIYEKQAFDKISFILSAFEIKK